MSVVDARPERRTARCYTRADADEAFFARRGFARIFVFFHARRVSGACRLSRPDSDSSEERQPSTVDAARAERSQGGRDGNNRKNAKKADLARRDLRRGNARRRDRGLRAVRLPRPPASSEERSDARPAAVPAPAPAAGSGGRSACGLFEYEAPGTGSSRRSEQRSHLRRAARLTRGFASRAPNVTRRTRCPRNFRRDPCVEMRAIAWRRRPRGRRTASWKASGESNHDFLEPFVNPTGAHQTFSTAGRIDTDNPFFQDLGTNGRTCFTCHRPESGWTITPAGVRERFEATGGPRPDLPHERRLQLAERRRVDRRGAPQRLQHAAHQGPHPGRHRHPGRRRVHARGGGRSLRVREQPRALALPAAASVHEPDLPQHGHVGRPRDVPRADDRLRPLGPGERRHDGTRPGSIPLSTEQREQIVDFETGLFTAQVYDVAAGDLGTQGAKGGPKNLSRQEFYIGINDPLGLNPTGAPFSPVVFTNFAAWARLKSSHGGDDDEDDEGRTAARLAVARGEDALQQQADQHHGSEGAQRRPRDRRASRARARRVTTRRTSAITRWRRRSTSASRTRRAGRPTCRSTRCGTRPRARRCRRPIPGARSSPASGSTSAGSRGRSCAASPRARPTSTTARPPRSTDVVRFYDDRFGIGLTEAGDLGPRRVPAGVQ